MHAKRDEERNETISLSPCKICRLGLRSRQARLFSPRLASFRFSKLELASRLFFSRLAVSQIFFQLLRIFFGTFTSRSWTFNQLKLPACALETNHVYTREILKKNSFIRLTTGLINFFY